MSLVSAHYVLFDVSECVAPHLNVVNLFHPHIYNDELDVNSMLCTTKTGGESTLTCLRNTVYS